MKPFRNLLILAFALFTINAAAQTDKATTKRIVEAKRYTFVATNAIPMNTADIDAVLSKMPGYSGGSNINLSGGNYDLKVTPDSVIAYLPYYGRAYAAPYASNDNGIKFTSTKFDYQMIKGKKRGWSAVIKINDDKENSRATLNISENGYATLILTTTNKQAITYNGYLAENNKDKN